jgi:hypothetical protein
VDALSNPAWRYSVCALYFWLVLGLGTVLLRSAYRKTVSPSPEAGADLEVAAG